jgi:hypothetical protein
MTGAVARDNRVAVTALPCGRGVAVVEHEAGGAVEARGGRGAERARAHGAGAYTASLLSST